MYMIKDQAQICHEFANSMRKKMLEMSEISSGPMHWGGSFSCAEILATLYCAVLNVKDKGLDDMHKDKFLLSKGHAAMAVYSAMNLSGLLSDELLETYQQDGSIISELLEADRSLGFETSGGSLGLGLSYGAGLALAAKRKNYPYKVYVLVGDGEMNEGSIWEALMFASQHRLDNLTLIIDSNGLQSDGPTSEIVGGGSMKDRLCSFGWNTISVDGHCCKQLTEALACSNEKGMPKAIIANTIKGKGVSFFENDFTWHDRSLKGTELEKAGEEVSRLVGNEL